MDLVPNPRVTSQAGNTAAAHATSNHSSAAFGIGYQYPNWCNRNSKGGVKNPGACIAVGCTRVLLKGSWIDDEFLKQSTKATHWQAEVLSQ
jgi:hypothetical protein